MRETDDIERLFRKSFEGFEVTPPASVKTVIDKNTASKKRLVWWLPALALVLATIAYSLIFMNPSTVEKRNNKQPFPAKNSPKATNGASINCEGYPSPAAEKNHLKNNGENAAISQNPLAQQKLNDLKKNKKTATTYYAFKTAQNDMHFSSTPKKTGLKKSLKNKVKPKKKAIHHKKPNDLKQDVDYHPNNNNNQETADYRADAAIKNDGSQSGNLSDSISIADADSIAVQDSTSTAGNNPVDSIPDQEKPKNDDKKWFASYYFGPQFDLWKASKPDFDLNLSPSFRTSVEISRNLKSGFSVSAGPGYNKFRDISTVTYPASVDSIVTLDSVPIYDQQIPDSIIGYNYFPNVSYDTAKAKTDFINTTTVFYLPVFIGKTIELTDHWVVMTGLGATFNFYKTTSNNSSDPHSPVKNDNSFGINAALRLYGGYKFSTNWMVTAGFNYSIYLKTPVVYNGINTQRMFISPQLGIHYSF